jgi:predicted amidohydrolase
VGAAQLGPNRRDTKQEDVVARMLELLREAKSRGCDLVVYPEFALSPWFATWWIEDQEEIDAFFDREMPNAITRPLFEEAKKHRIGFNFSYAELTEEKGETRHYNTSILVDPSGEIVGKYRKIHLPGHTDNRPHLPFQVLEKRYFDVGNLGFNTWRTMGGVIGLCTCNDRRWPETYRVLAMKGAEMILLGYNTPDGVPWDPVYDHLMSFHNHLVMQSGAYQNGSWVVGVAKAGREDYCNLIGGSCIIAPTGEIVAQALTQDDELITAVCDLDYAQRCKEIVFNFAEHRQIEHYGIITSQRGETPPA